MVPKETGPEAYFVVAGRYSDEIADYDQAVSILWDQHAHYDQYPSPAP